MIDPNKLQALFFKGSAEQNFIGHILAEIYKDGVYEPYLRGKKDLVIGDFGANVGIASYYFSQFAQQVYAVEPSLEHVDTMTRMLDFNGITNVKIIPRAIYHQETQLPLFHKDNNKTMYSLIESVATPGSQPEMVQTITLDRLFEQEGIEHMDFMKADLEGSECEVFAGSGFRTVAPLIDVIAGEYHTWAPRNRQQLVEAFKNNNYDFEWVANDAAVFVATRKK